MFRRDMAGYLTVPYPVRNVEFVGARGQIEKVAGITQFVGKIISAQMHRFFVERHKDNTVDVTITGQLERVFSAL